MVFSKTVSVVVLVVVATVLTIPLALFKINDPNVLVILVLLWVAVLVEVVLWLKGKMILNNGDSISTNENPTEDLDLPIFDMVTIQTATDEFSPSNKIGQGGFGPVYKTWKLLNGNKALEVVDDLIGHSFTASEVLRCIQVGLLCVQKFPEDRPTMASVVSMLDTEGAVLHSPKEPGFYTEQSPLNVVLSPAPDIVYTVNEVTVTLPEGR